jgi:hypothetical protein
MPRLLTLPQLLTMFAFALVLFGISRLRPR